MKTKALTNATVFNLLLLLWNGPVTAQKFWYAEPAQVRNADTWDNKFASESTMDEWWRSRKQMDGYVFNMNRSADEYSRLRRLNNSVFRRFVKFCGSRKFIADTGTPTFWWNRSDAVNNAAVAQDAELFTNFIADGISPITIACQSTLSKNTSGQTVADVSQATRQNAILSYINGVKRNMTSKDFSKLRFSLIDAHAARDQIPRSRWRQSYQDLKRKMADNGTPLSSIIVDYPATFFFGPEGRSSLDELMREVTYIKDKVNVDAAWWVVSQASSPTKARNEYRTAAKRITEHAKFDKLHAVLFGDFKGIFANDFPDQMGGGAPYQALEIFRSNMIK